MLESKIEEAVCKHAKQHGLLVYKFTSPNRRSVPDRMFLVRGGGVFFIEFKAPGKENNLTPGQEREIERLRNLGHRVYVISDIEAGKRFVNFEATGDFTQLSIESDRLQPPSSTDHVVVGHGLRQNSDKPD